MAFPMAPIMSNPVQSFFTNRPEPEIEPVVPNEARPRDNMFIRTVQRLNEFLDKDDLKLRSHVDDASCNRLESAGLGNGDLVLDEIPAQLDDPF